MFLEKNKIVSILSKLIFIIAIFIIGVLMGRLYEKISESSSYNLILECKSCNDYYGILNITEVSPLGIKGEITAGDLRITAGDQVVSGKNTRFEISTVDIYRSLKFVVPEGAKYFASQKGKKLYDISDEKYLDKISPKNIIFFKTLNEAKRYGFKGT